MRINTKTINNTTIHSLSYQNNQAYISNPNFLLPSDIIYSNMLTLDNNIITNFDFFGSSLALVGGNNNVKYAFPFKTGSSGSFLKLEKVYFAILADGGGIAAGFYPPVTVSVVSDNSGSPTGSLITQSYTTINSQGLLPITFLNNNILQPDTIYWIILESSPSSGFYLVRSEDFGGLGYITTGLVPFEKNNSNYSFPTNYSVSYRNDNSNESWSKVRSFNTLIPIAISATSI